MPRYDAVVVGSGPNGLAAAIRAAQQGAHVLLIEGKETVGGGMRSAELTLPGYVHDVCSAIHPLTAASPFFRTLPLSDYGLEWIAPPAELAHPLEGGDAVIVRRSVEATAAAMGVDERSYQRLFRWLTDRYGDLFDDLLGPLPLPPRHPILLGFFGLRALLPAYTMAKWRFRGERARAVFGGMACHSIMPLETPATAAFGMMLGLTAHAIGWVFPRGGAQRIADALAAHFRALGGEIITGQMIGSLDELPPATAVFLDVTPRQLVRMAGDRLPGSYRRRLEGYRYGAGVFKMDFALSAPIPWLNREVGQAATVHLGGTLDELTASERAVGRDEHPERPFVLLAQHSLFDPSRALEGKQTVWAYCHVPNGSTVDMSERIEAQIERFAPGFRDLILAKASSPTQALERYNPNYVGGDINGGVQDLRQLYTRPMLRLNPYSTALKGVYLCSSSTPRSRQASGEGAPKSRHVQTGLTMTPQQKFLSNPGADEMPRSADVVIIGGGPAGTAALWALERLAPGTKTVLIEQSDRLGAGSSLASLENFRTCWPALCLARQMKRSVEVFHNAEEYLGEGAAQSIAVKQRGYLFCAFTPAQADGLRADVRRLHEIGLDHIEYLDADEVRYRFGWVGERVIAAKYDPIAGWLDSNALVYKYVQSARPAQVLLGIPEVGICVEGGRVTGVTTPNGKIAAPNVVVAAGANARAVGRTAGVELPVVLRPRQSFTTGWRHLAFPEHAPMVIGAAPFPHVRPEAQSGAIFGWEYTWHNKYAGEQYGTNDAHDAIIDPVYPAAQLKDPRFPSLALALLARQFGEDSAFGDPRYLRGISHNIGYYVYRDETTAYRTDADGTRHAYDSERAIIDAYPGIDGLFVSIAHVGHGIMSSPAAGEILARKVLRQPPAEPEFAAFGFDAAWVEYDEGVL